MGRYPAKRIWFSAIGALALLASGCGGAGGSSGSQAEISIAAVEPLSGAFADSGADDIRGEQFAVDQINNAGGIKSLNGAKLKLVKVDAGDTPAAATAAAQAALKPGITAATGSWYSSLSLADTAVAEAKQIPWVTDSGSDAIVQRNFHYVFKTSASLTTQTDGLKYLIQQLTKGEAPTIAIAGDNNVANNAFYSKLDAWVKEGLVKVGVKQVWTPPLHDATPVASAVVASHPALVVLTATSTTDETEVLRSLASLGNKAPILGTAASWDNPSYLTTIGANAMNGIITPSSLPYPGKGSEAVVSAYSKATKQAWMDAEACGAYIDVEVIAAGLEQAKSSDPQKLADALHSMSLKNFAPIRGMFPGDNQASFDASGQRVGGNFLLIQWISGRPQVVYPTAYATAQAQLG